MQTLTALVETTETDVLRLPCGALYDSVEIGRKLMIVHRQFAKDTAVADAQFNRVPAETVVLTSDGRGYLPEWHQADVDGDEDCELVYVERYGQHGREMHGWIDPASRKLIQVG